jgi:ethanolamine ammonia-lyase large subunit
MLNYQSTSFHDALYLRKVLGLRASPEFEKWLIKQHIMDKNGNLLVIDGNHSLLTGGSA